MSKTQTTTKQHTDASKYDDLPTKSAKIRAMAADGWSRSNTAKALNIRYQHVRNVLVTPLKRKS